MVSTPSGVDALPIKEQLQLFSSLHGKTHKPHALSKRQSLSALLAGDLNFHGEDSSYASHDVHAFAAKFPPQLPRAFIRGLTAPGDLVLDPMMGSGTTIVEALLEGRRGIGLDIDPLALRVSHAKTIPMSADDLRDIGLKVISQAQDLLSDHSIERLIEKFDSRTKAFIDYWFYPHTQRELAALVLSIQTVDISLVRRFLELTFSSIIVTKSGGVSRARDLAHSRPHLDQEKTPKNALAQFSLRLQKNIKSMGHLETKSSIAAPLPGDARAMPLKNEVIDLIVTSPPYANAIDYMRAHKFPWCGWVSPSSISPNCAPGTLVRKRSTARSIQAARQDESIIQELEKHDRKNQPYYRNTSQKCRRCWWKCTGCSVRMLPPLSLSGHPSCVVSTCKRITAWPRLPKKRALT